MNKRMVWMLTGCVVVFGGVFGFKWFGGKMMNQYFDNMPMPPAAISAAAAQQIRWVDSLSGVGTVIASQGAMVTTEAAGIVAAIHAESGGHVQRGALLVTLSSGTEQADLQRLQAQARLAQSELSRIERLFKLEAVSKADYDKARADADAAASAVAGQQARLAQKQIRAPFAGELGIRQISVGQYLAAGAPIISLQALSPVFVDFTLPEQDLARVRIGQTVNTTIDAQPGRNFQGLVVAVDSLVDSKTRNFKVRARFDNDDKMLRPGLFARAAITLDQGRDVITVPRTAVSYNPYGNSVYVVQKVRGKGGDGKPTDELVVRRRFVKTGEARGDLVVINEGLKVGEQVATSGLLKLQNDSKVLINNQVSPPAALAPTPADS